MWSLGRGVAGCGRDDQERAVKQWLADNEPNKVRALSLTEDGFLDTNASGTTNRRSVAGPIRQRRHVLGQGSRGSPHEQIAESGGLARDRPVSGRGRR